MGSAHPSTILRLTYYSDRAGQTYIPLLTPAGAGCRSDRLCYH